QLLPAVAQAASRLPVRALEAEERDHLGGGVGEARIGRADEPRPQAATGLLAGGDQVVAHRELRKHLHALERACETEPTQFARAQTGDRPPVEPHIAGRGCELPEDTVEQSRLTAAARANDAENLAALERER